MEQRALALDEQQLAATRDALEHEPLRGAGDEVGDDRVDRDAPAGDRDPGLARRDELAPRCRARRARGRARARRVIFPIAQSEPTVSTTCAPCVEVLAGRHVEPGRRLAQVAQLDAVARARARRAPGRPR